MISHLSARCFPPRFHLFLCQKASPVTNGLPHAAEKETKFAAYTICIQQIRRCRRRRRAGKLNLLGLRFWFWILVFRFWIQRMLVKGAAPLEKQGTRSSEQRRWNIYDEGPGQAEKNAAKLNLWPLSRIVRFVVAKVDRTMELHTKIWKCNTAAATTKYRSIFKQKQNTKKKRREKNLLSNFYAAPSWNASGCHWQPRTTKNTFSKGLDTAIPGIYFK